MLRSLKDPERYKVSAIDGDIGSVENFLLDDERWTIRYNFFGRPSYWASHDRRD
jgi:hypothetical protein